MVTRAIRNNNPLNIEYRPKNKWLGLKETRTDSRFCEFVNIKYGFRAALIILRKYLAPIPSGHGCRNLSQVIQMWAPPAENNVAKYIEFVERRSGVPRTEPLKFADREKIVSIVQAMACYESGTRLSNYYIYEAYDTLTK